jgi:uncharacterized protein YegP (UPF0339 family)
MKTLKINLEKHLMKTISIEVPDDTNLCSDFVEAMIKNVHKQVKDGSITFSLADANGRIMTNEELYDNEQCVESSEWTELQNT